MDTLYEQLCLDHRNLTRLMTALESLLDDLARSERDPATLSMILDSIDYISVYPDKWHHPIEEKVMEKLRAKPECDQALLDEIHSEHNGLADATRHMATLFYAIANDCAVERNNLLGSAREYVAMQRQHIKLENRKLFPMMEKLMSEDDWREVRRSIDAKADPLFSASIRQQYDVLYQYVVESAKQLREPMLNAS
ncbi:hemerythrin domain-containing protein [Biformimicrobium ophioploci]|uniref:Hemerythrin domain-containing protein n=1 Tax=Biformimicrobium ophioploci TaxID=3036711 RepID=A0ABQ6M041_9GAMM|nr:hemerythrin domain-containing protein [Microbulbifer sp. NKW57]GMG87705.1 hemerythrin domain-containing protein [Microbulbifer sp. NKW57]